MKRGDLLILPSALLWLLVNLGLLSDGVFAQQKLL